jgi:hypothetical protein
MIVKWLKDFLHHLAFFCSGHSLVYTLITLKFLNKDQRYKYIKTNTKVIIYLAITLRVQLHGIYLQKF